jgi:hypothetical protein
MTLVSDDIPFTMAPMFITAQTFPRRPGSILDMRSIHLFLVGYFVVMLGVGLGLWQVGVFSRVAPIWVAVGALVAVGVGIMLAVASGKPTAIERVAK